MQKLCGNFNVIEIEVEDFEYVNNIDKRFWENGKFKIYKSFH